MLIMSVVGSLILLFLANSFYGARKPGVACGVSAVGAFFGLPFFMFPALMLTGAAMFVCCLICIARAARAPTFLKWSFIVLLASHAVFGVEAFRSAKQDADLAAKYPMESMDERLAYKPRGKLIHEDERLTGSAAAILEQGDARSQLVELENKVVQQEAQTGMRNLCLRVRLMKTWRGAHHRMRLPRVFPRRAPCQARNPYSVFMRMDFSTL
jgi:hypothetical protein